MSAAAAIREAVRTILYPAPHESYLWGYAVLAAAFVFESASLVVGGRARPIGRAVEAGHNLQIVLEAEVYDAVILGPGVYPGA